MKRLFLLLILITISAAFANAQTTGDIRKIDFPNYTFRLENSNVKMKDGLQMDACEEKDEDGIPSGDIWNVSADSIAYGDLNGDGQAEAIVPLVANVCGGNMITNEAVLVFTVKKGKPEQMPSFEYYDEGCQTGEKGCNFSRTAGVSVSYDAQSKAIVVTNNFSTDDDAICCPSLYRETWFKWNGSAFVELKKGKLTKRPQNE